MYGLMSITTNAQSGGCRPTVHFYHIGHGTISGWVDQPILDGMYKVAYTVRQHIARIQGHAVSALTEDAKILYFIQSECRAASPRGGMSVSLIDAQKNITQTITYPMGFNLQPITVVSDRGEQVLIECVDNLLFSFNIMLKGSTYVIARVRNIRVPQSSRKGIKDIFTLEVDELYRSITPFLIATALAIDEYTYPSSIQQKRKNCN
jgi:hypothetical protein